jgi:hypothetical protein
LFNHFREKCEQNNVVLNKLRKLVTYYDDDTTSFSCSKLLSLEIDTDMDTGHDEAEEIVDTYDRVK